MTYDDTAKFGVQNPKRERIKRETLGNPNEGTQESPKRARVRITSYRTRLLDKDNAYGGAKPLLDSLKYAGLVPDDSTEAIDYEVLQRKVHHRSEEHTEVVIEYA